MTSLQVLGIFMAMAGGLLMGHAAADADFAVIGMVIAGQMIFWGIMLAGGVIT